MSHLVSQWVLIFLSLLFNGDRNRVQPQPPDPVVSAPVIPEGGGAGDTRRPPSGPKPPKPRPEKPEDAATTWSDIKTRYGRGPQP